MNKYISNNLDYILNLTNQKKPKIGIVLGSGLKSFANIINNKITIKYSDLNGFPQPKVEGHQGELIIGNIESKLIACLSGRSHPYEGDISSMVNPIRTLKSIGCDEIIFTNSAGCLVKSWKVGDLMIIKDHINFIPGNPLVGDNDNNFGPRFPNLDNVYEVSIRNKFKKAANLLKINLREGVYIACLGPNFETPAEINAFRIMGADAVGMSTIPEVLIAKHCGLKISGISVLTNFASGIEKTPLTHEETLLNASKSSKKLIELVNLYISEFN
ncbi:purine-nucleoside phosphorylase [Alphaproteobacteria bacterium]|nr:purine-nucleoside phosphorylase [Alphaproteobacteria bacterium]